MKHKLKIDAFAQKRKRYTREQKLFLGYVVVLFLFMMFFPIIEVAYIESTQVNTFSFLNVYMPKTILLVFFTLLFLVGYNMSAGWRFLLQKHMGFSHSEQEVNIVGFLLLFFLLFGTGDLVYLVQENMSPLVSTRYGFLLVGIYLLLGVLINIAIMRWKHKKVQEVREVHVINDKDSDYVGDRFQRAKEKVQGLFGHQNDGDLQ